MSFDRTTLIKGPGFATYSSASLHSDDDIVATLHEEWSDGITAGFGRIGRRLKNRWVEGMVKPSMFQDLSVLFPFGTSQPGDAVFGASDLPLVITPRNGRPLTIVNAAVTGLASLRLSADQPLFQSAIKFTGLCANSGDPSLMASYFTQGAVGSAVLQTGFDATKIMRGRFTGTRNSVTMRADKGFGVEFKLSLEPDQPDGEPVCNYRHKSAPEASCKVTPAGMLEATYLGMLNGGVDIGGTPTLYDLVVASAVTGQPTVTLGNTIVEEGGGFAYGPTVNRTGELVFTTVRKLTTNVLAAAWTIAAV